MLFKKKQTNKQTKKQKEQQKICSSRIPISGVFGFTALMLGKSHLQSRLSVRLH